MGKKTSSKLSEVIIVVLLLCIFIYRTESALPSHYESLSLITGRRMMAYTPNGGIETPPSKGKCGHQKGRRLETYYKPNGDIFTGPSHSGHGKPSRWNIVHIQDLMRPDTGIPCKVISDNISPTRNLRNRKNREKLLVLRDSGPLLFFSIIGFEKIKQKTI